jgi:hypothetical protein
MTNFVTNKDRAARGRVALDAYARGIGTEDLGEALADLLADLMHMTNADEAMIFSFDECLERADLNYDWDLYDEEIAERRRNSHGHRSNHKPL